MDKKCIDIKNFILTGTPGSGKTSVIREIEKLGFNVIHEAATDLIALWQMNNIDRPWEEAGFIDKIIYIQRERQIKANGDLQFYDRSPFCTYALNKYLCNSKNIEFRPSNVLLNEIDRCVSCNVYQKNVFFFENLGFIDNNNIRKITYQDALIFEQIHFDVYKKFDFEITIIPKDMSVIKRCEFVLDCVLSQQ